MHLQLEGEFDATVTPAFRGGRAHFEASLHRAGTPSGHVIGLARYGGGRPAVGRYPLAPLDRADPGGRFYATYHADPGGGRAPSVGDTVRAYVSLVGELEVTASSPNLVQGTLRFIGAEYTARWGTGRRGSGNPGAVDPGAPGGVVIATFAAARRDPAREVACMGTGGPSVVVEVRDQAGRPAATGASLVVAEGAFRDSAGPHGSWDGLHLGAGERRPGRYAVRVTKPGYRPAVLADVAAPPTGDPRCRYAEPAGTHRVTLVRLPGAPVVRSVVVLPPVTGLDGIPGTEHGMAAAVDADPGRSRAVRWTSSDPSLLRVRRTSDSTAVVVPQCRATGGAVTVTAAAVADPRVRGTATVEVTPPNDTRGLGPPAAKALADACLERLARLRRVP